jgi:hypothetical protein
LSVPNIPNNQYTTQADGRVFIQWDLAAGAISYTVQRSLDSITFTTISTPTVPQYLDSTVSVGTAYYYQVSATNITGTSPYTTSQLIIPTMGGEMSLSELDIRSRQRADRLNSMFVTKPEINSYINQSMFELYDLLITVYEDYFKAPSATFLTTGGNQQLYPMPNGLISFLNDSKTSFIADPIYKLLGVDLGLSASTQGNNGWVSMGKYNYLDRNKYFYPTPGSTIYGVFECQYRWMGTNIELIPTPSGNQPIRLQYIPRLKSLLMPTDMTTTSISGWLEYVLTDVAIKILQKEESDVSVLMAQKQALMVRIESSANNKDAGRPDTITDVRSGNPYSNSSGGNGFQGGF